MRRTVSSSVTDKEKYMNEIILELDKYNAFASKATCEITKDLDYMSNLDSSQYYDFFHHYIYFSAGDISEHLLAIRVPGGTVGSIEFDDNYVIKSIGVDTNYVIQTYFRNVNKHIQRKYIGSKLVFPKEILEKFYSQKQD